MPANTVKVDRSTKYGNLFRIDREHDAAEVVRLHWLLVGAGYRCLSYGPPLKVQDAHMAFLHAHIAELRGKNLACWCALDAPRDADTLLEAANQPRTPPCS